MKKKTLNKPKLVSSAHAWLRSEVQKRENLRKYTRLDVPKRASHTRLELEKNSACFELFVDPILSSLRAVLLFCTPSTR